MNSEPIRVFIAEDEPKGYKLIHMLVDWAELNMVEIGNSQDGLEALDQISKLKPDIVVTDIRMPGIDGLELIRRHKSTGAKTRFVVISGHREFDYARKALKLDVDDYILKPLQKEELNRTLKKIGSRLRSISPEKALEQQLAVSRDRYKKDVMERILQACNNPNDSGINQLCEEFDREVSNRGIFQAVFAVSGLSVKNEEQELSFLSNLEEKFIDISQRVVGRNCLDFHSGAAMEGIAMLLRYEDSEEENVSSGLKEFAENLLIRLEPLGGGGIIIGIGPKGSGALSWLRSIRSAIASVRDRRERAKNEAVFCKGAAVYKDYSGLDPAEIKSMANFAETLDYEAFETWLDVFIGKISGETPGRFLHAAAEELCDRFLRALPENTVSAIRKNIFEGLYDGFRHADSPQDILNAAREPLCGTMRRIERERHARESLPVRKIREYIDVHYASPIHLEDMASRFQMNPTYLGTLFKKETGILFSDYLTQRRIEAAKEALRTERSTLAQVAREVGYPEAKYFFKVFRKHIGITPGEYRRIYQ